MVRLWKAALKLVTPQVNNLTCSSWRVMARQINFNYLYAPSLCEEAAPFDLTQGSIVTLTNPRNAVGTDLTIELANLLPGPGGVLIGGGNGGPQFPGPIDTAGSPAFPGGFTSITFNAGPNGPGIPAGGTISVDFDHFPANTKFEAFVSYNGTPVQSPVTVITFQGGPGGVPFPGPSLVPVPEPSTFMLLTASLIAMWVYWLSGGLRIKFLQRQL